MLIVRSIMYSSPTAVSSRRWRFMQTAVSLRWQRSVGRVARLYKPSSAPNFFRAASGPDPRGRSKDVAPGVHARHGDDAVLPRSDVRLRPSISRAGLGVGSAHGAHSLKQRLAR